MKEYSRKIFRVGVNHRGFTLLEILLATSLLLVAVAYLTRVYYGAGAISADSQRELHKIILAQNAMEVVVAGITDPNNLNAFKTDTFFEDEAGQPITREIFIKDPPSATPDFFLDPDSDIDLIVEVTRRANPNSSDDKIIRDFTIEVTVTYNDDDSDAFKLTHELLGV